MFSPVIYQLRISSIFPYAFFNVLDNAMSFYTKIVGLKKFFLCKVEKYLKGKTSEEHFLMTDRIKFFYVCMYVIRVAVTFATRASRL